MCGICGMFGPTVPVEVRESAVKLMASHMVHRGPDASGFWSDGCLSLGHRRLSILDLAGGAQPMTNEDGTVVISFNGEIYNYEQLAESLSGRHHLRTRSDTEVIVHLYEECGPECLTQLRGMFALALWDTRRKHLLLARDRFGKKPLYYSRHGCNLYFASELLPLLQVEAISKDPDLSFIPDYLARGYLAAPCTGFKDIQKLRPATYLLITASTMKEETYWSPPVAQKQFRDLPEALAAVDEKLHEATRLRMISDVPLGAFLSGGVDSSLVVAVMAQHSSDPIKTFSMGFQESSWSELPYARQVAEHLGTEHHEFIVDPSDISWLPKVMESYGELNADPVSITNYLLASQTRRHVTVALNGDGGDELFAGYPRYLGLQLLASYRRIPAVLRRAIAKVVALLPESTHKRDLRYRIKKLLQPDCSSLVHLYDDLHCFFTRPERLRLLGPAFGSAFPIAHAGAALGAALGELEGSSDRIKVMQQCDQTTYLPGQLLTRCDRMCMLASLEARSPFLDHELAAVAAAVPTRLNTRRWCVKWFLKELACKYVPREIVHRPKHGFQVPTGDWFLGRLRPVADKLLTESHLARDGWLDSSAIAETWDEHTSRRRNCGDRLWNLLILELWYQRFVTRGSYPEWITDSGEDQGR